MTYSCLNMIRCGAASIYKLMHGREVWWGKRTCAGGIMLCQDLCSLAFFQHRCVCGSFTVCRFNWCDHHSAGYRRLSISHMA